MVEKSIIGKEFPESSFEVEKGKIKEFARAIGDPNPLYRDEAAAKKEGLDGLALPPTFGTVFSLSGETSLLDMLTELNINIAKVLHGGQEYIFINPIKPGDTVTGKTVITDVIDKGKMDLVIMETEYVNQNGTPVLKDKSTIVVRR